MESNIALSYPALLRHDVPKHLVTGWQGVWVTRSSRPTGSGRQGKRKDGLRTTFFSSRHPEAASSPCHPEGRSPVRVSGQVDTVSGSQGPHALRAQDDNLSFSRHPEAYPHSRHPEARSAVRVSGQVGTVSGSQGPHALRAQDDNLSFSRHTRGRPWPQPGNPQTKNSTLFNQPN